MVGWLLLPRQVSGIIGLVGGLIDVFAGLSILSQESMKMSLIRGSMMLGAYALLALGAVVLVTGAYVLAFSAMRRFTIGVLMISYGLVMLALGVGMVGRLIIVMIQGSASSGTVMILLGLAMLYSGFDMTRNYTDRLHPSHPL